MQSTAANAQKSKWIGYLCAIGAQVWWGCFSIYIDLLSDDVQSFELVGHRAIWSFVCLFGLAIACGNKSVCGSRSICGNRSIPGVSNAGELKRIATQSGVVKFCAIAALLVAINWVTFVWAVSNGHALDASLGYYICPQVVVMLAVIFLGERLRPLQWIAVIVAACGVVYMTQSKVGALWISLVVAVSFGFYGFAKKKTSLTAFDGLTIETGIMFVPALAFLVFRASSGVACFASTWWQNVLIVGIGVATIVPLLLYAEAMKRIPMSTVGVLQFIGPTIQFVIGVFYFREQLDFSRVVGFVIVWIGVVLFLLARPRQVAKTG